MEALVSNIFFSLVKKTAACKKEWQPPDRMVWSQLEPTPAHLTYLVLTSFLIVYALFSVLVRNRLHLSEPPLATIWVSQPGVKDHCHVPKS